MSPVIGMAMMKALAGTNPLWRQIKQHLRGIPAQLPPTLPQQRQQQHHKQLGIQRNKQPKIKQHRQGSADIRLLLIGNRALPQPMIIWSVAVVAVRGVQQQLWLITRKLTRLMTNKMCRHQPCQLVMVRRIRHMNHRPLPEILYRHSNRIAPAKEAMLAINRINPPPCALNRIRPVRLVTKMTIFS